MNGNDFQSSPGPARWAPVGLAAMLGLGLLLTPDTPPVGSATLRAGGRGPGPYSGPAWQVSSQRPRLLVHSGHGPGQGPTLAALREKRLAADRPHWAELSANRKGWEGLLTPALRALLLGDLDVRVEVIQRLEDRKQDKVRSSGRQAGGHMAIAFDWLHDSLSEEERQVIARNIARGADNALLFLHTGEPDITHNFTYMAVFTVLTSGLSLFDVPGFEQNARRYLDEAQNWLEGRGGLYETCNALGGGWPEGVQYGYRENTRLLILMMHALRSATDHDPFERVRLQYGDFVRRIARSYMAMTRPDMTLERLGDVNRNTALLHDQHRFVIEAIAEGLRGDGGDPQVAGMLQHFSDLIHEAYGARDTHGNFQWGMLLFGNPQAPREILAYRHQPLLQVFGRGTLDLVVMRDGWNADGTMLTFIAGNHFVDHQHFDKGAFTLFHHGALLIDSGAYNGMYSSHHRQYASRTLAHNAPLIFDADRPRPERYADDGGQLVLRGLQHHASWTEYEAHLESEHLDAAQLLCAAQGIASPWNEEAGEDTAPSAPSADWRRFAIAQAELAPAYGGPVRTARRTLAWAPAARVVIVSDVFRFSAPLEVAFLAHSQAAPLAADKEARRAGVHDLGRVPWWTLQRSGSFELPEHTFVNDGRLFLRTVVPEKHAARLIGGKGYQWFVGDDNVSPGSAGNQPRESGRWRIEVHSDESTHHEMTHVLQVAASGQFAMADSRPLQAGPWSATHVRSAPEVVLLVARDDAPDNASYEIDSALPSLHLTVGWPPQAHLRVTIEAQTQEHVADAEGVLAFEDPHVGPHRIQVVRLD